jgi:hypothetical protein
LIDSIAVSGRDKFTVKKAANGTWVVSGAETFPADELLMRDWLAALTNIEVDILQTVEADLARYGLDKPAAPLLQYDLVYAPVPGRTNPPAVELIFGAGTNQSGVLFERRPDEQSVNTISSGQFARLPEAYWELRDRSIWSFETNEVVGIEVRQHRAERKFTRDREKQWRLVWGPPGAVVPAAIDETLYRLGRLRAVFWSGIGADSLDQFGFAETDYQISLEISRGGRMETNSIEFGRASPYLHPYASVERDGRRLIFEFPADLYNNLVAEYLSVPPESPQPR